MTTIHPKAKFIRLWLDGVPLQWRHTGPNGEWQEADGLNMLGMFQNPEIEWREKPETTFKYRVSLMGYKDERDGKWLGFDTNEEDAKYREEKHGNFIEWLTEWKEVKI